MKIVLPLSIGWMKTSLPVMPSPIIEAMGRKKWDVFVCHASEDKGSFVRPLARLLRKLGVRVWYDEFELKLGDSLTGSIDAGLAASRYGIVVISPSFFEKGWTKRELRGLTVTETASSRKVILPIWHHVTEHFVRTHSPPLADKKAIATSNTSLGSIALAVIRIVRPDLHETLILRFLFERAGLKPPRIELVPISELRPGPIRHTTLPPSLVTRIKVIHAALSDVLSSSYQETLNNFKRDLHPESEVQHWERLVAAYLSATTRRPLIRAQRREVFDILFAAWIGRLDERLGQLKLFNRKEALTIAAPLLRQQSQRAVPSSR